MTSSRMVHDPIGRAVAAERRAEAAEAALDALVAERDEARRERDDARLAFDIHDEALTAAKAEVARLRPCAELLREWRDFGYLAAGGMNGTLEARTDSVLAALEEKP